MCVVMKNINYSVEGNGDVIVFIHGLSDNLIYWEVLSSVLKNDYKIVRFDLRGHGKSEWGNAEISLDVFSQDLKDLLDYLEIDKANLVGFSLGGAVALDFSLRYPDSVSSLVLMSAFFKATEDFQNILDQFKLKLDESFDAFYNFILPMVLCPDVIEDNLEELELIKETASQTANVCGIKNAVDICKSVDLSEKLSDIDMPTLILAGKYDDMCPVNMQKELNSEIKNSKLVVFDDVKHNLLVGKNIPKILDVLQKFFKKK